MTFKEAAIVSADIYYKHLEEKQRGMLKYSVTHISNDVSTYVLTLAQKPKSVEYCLIQIHNVVYQQEDIRLLEYDKIFGELRIRPSAVVRNILNSANPTDVFIVSDLKFLVKRVGKWYHTYGNLLSLPTKFPCIPMSALSDMTQTPSDEQNHAIGGALSNPFSYVWGAPGTGKTRFVLSHCIAAYVKSGKRVLITAPTNNAVEQTLYGVLSVLEDSGIAIDRVLRLGVPSRKFYNKYPFVCEDSETARIITEINDRIIVIDEQIEKTDYLLTLLPEYQNYLNYLNAFQLCEKQLPALLEKFVEALSEKRELGDSLSVADGKCTILKENLNNLNSKCSELSSQIARLNALVRNYSRGLRKLLFPRRKKLYVNDLQKALISLEACTKERDSVQLQLIETELTATVLKAKNDTVCNDLEVCETKIAELTEFSTDFNELSQNLYTTNINNICQQSTSILESIRNDLDEKSAVYAPLVNTTKQSLLDEKTSLQNKKDELISKRKKTESECSGISLGQCLVLATTVDTLLSRVQPNGDYKPDHIFLDEAGYCSIIKAAPLLAYNCPVTFLGDHMQLPPICEMDDKTISQANYLPVSLWAQSALHTESIFTSSVDKLFADYIKHVLPTFQYMQKFDLTHTYRFGEELANVLAKHVYQNGFHGNPDHSTEIYYIDAPKHYHSVPRTSTHEADAICAYVVDHPREDIGIIAPYKKQCQTIKECLRKHSLQSSDDLVMTVHGAQGREWDTILLSVTDTSDMWFTNSRSPISNGKALINTAVSRARKKLVIVCDASYWKPLENQLIGSLLSVASKAPNDK